MPRDTDERFEIAEFGFIGRTFEEYCRMFDLAPESLADEERILDCPSGPSSFVAAASASDLPIRGADILYDQPAERLARRCQKDITIARREHRDKPELFVWDFYESPNDRYESLQRARRRFLDDYPSGRREGRYLAAQLPDLPFKSDQFSLVLSSHFLFLYGDRLDYSFHRQSLYELLRVCSGELRVFPLVGLDTEPYGRLDELIDELTGDGYHVETRTVPFEFQRGATEMLVITV